VYGWYSDNSVFLEDPGVDLRPAFIRTLASKLRRLLDPAIIWDRHLTEVLQ